MLEKLFKLSLFLFFSWIISGCKSDNEPWVYEKDADVSVYFHLSVDGAVDRLSRGSWNDNLDNDGTNDYPEQVGSEFENKIETNSVQVLVYKGETYIGLVKKHLCYPLAQSAVYEFVGSVPQSKLTAGQDYKFMVVANSAISGDNGVGDPTFSIDNTQNGLNNYIPLWGVHQYKLAANTQTNKLQSRYDLGNIYLLRSVAKVQVRLNDEMAKSYKLESATINYANQNGYVLPGNWKKVSKTTELTHDGQGAYPAFRPKDSGITNRQFASEVKDKQQVLYLPEFTNTEAKEAVVSVRVFDIEANKSYEFNNDIKFRKNDVQGKPTGALYNIERNFCYQFTINKINTGVDLLLTCFVKPWNVYEEVWDYTDQIAVGKKLTWDGSTYNSLDSKKCEVIVKPGTDLTCDFKIDTPTGATWHASFVPIQGKKDAFKFVSDTQSLVNEVTGKVGETGKLTIRPTDPNNTENNSVLLKIVVITVDGRTIHTAALMPTGVSSDAEKGYTITQSK